MAPSVSFFFLPLTSSETNLNSESSWKCQGEKNTYFPSKYDKTVLKQPNGLDKWFDSCLGKAQNAGALKIPSGESSWSSWSWLPGIYTGRVSQPGKH